MIFDYMHGAWSSNVHFSDNFSITVTKGWYQRINLRRFEGKGKKKCVPTVTALMYITFLFYNITCSFLLT